jgi:hypothetical protein
MAEQNITEQLVEFLRSKKVGFILLSSLPTPLKKSLGLKSDTNVGEIEKAIAPYLGGKLETRKKGSSYYLWLVQPLDETIFRALSSKGGETVGQLKNKVPLKTEEPLHEPLNALIDKGLIHLKLSKTLLPCVYRASTEAPQHTPAAPQEKKGPMTEALSTEEQFRAAFQELEGGKFYVRICDMRRRLNWPGQEFDMMLIKLRDAGQLQLQDGDTDFFTAEDIRDSFVDENGFRMLTMMWRKK